MTGLRILVLETCNYLFVILVEIYGLLLSCGRSCCTRLICPTLSLRVAYSLLCIQELEVHLGVFEGTYPVYLLM